MMRASVICRVLFLCFALLMLLSPASAQDTPPYRLRELTASEYVDGVLNQVISYDLFCPFEFNTACRFPKILALEPMLRYDHMDVDYPTLRQAYEMIVREARFEDTAARYWTEQVILSWLREHVSTVDTMPNVAIDGFTIQVTPFDADSDGQSEWLLKVDTGSRGFAGLLPLKHNSNGTFEFIPTPLPVERPCCFVDFDYQTWNSVALITVEDVNGDGKNEIVAFNGGSSRYDTNYSGRVYILGLRDGAVVDLMAEPLNYTEPAYLTSRSPEPLYQTLGHSWQFSAASGTPELIQTQRHEDNFGCATYETSHYKWQAGSFSLTSPEPALRYEDGLGCTLRKAQEAFWIGDLKIALDLYNQMLALPPMTSTVPSNMARVYPQQRAYALIRSGLAQALLGDMDAATTAFKAAQQETDDRQFTALISGLLAANDSAFHVCEQAYLFFLQEYRQGNFWPSFVNALYEPPGGSYPPPSPSPDPAKAGCDLGALVENAFSQLRWTANKTPSEQLEAAGIQPGETLKTDLNGDGKLDWVVWITDGIDAFAFLSTSGVDYRVVRAAIPAPSEQVSVSPLTLPDKTGNALVIVNSSSEVDSINARNGYYCPNFSGEGRQPIFELWQVTETGIEQRLQVPVCDGQQSPQDLFPSDGTLRVGAPSASGSGYETATYTWDSDEQQFRAPEIAVPTATQADSIFSASLKGGYWTLSGASFLSLLETYEPEVVLERINEWLQDNPDDQMTLYERGVVLDLMGDNDGALADFIRVHEQSKDTEIGRLAGLHLES